MTFYLVYKTTHLPTSRFYIGRHVTEKLDDGYLGSGSAWNYILEAHPQIEFERETLYLASTGKEMLDLEKAYITEMLDHPLCFNCIIGDPSTIGVIKHSLKSRQRMSIARKGRIFTKVWRKNLSLAKLGKKASPEARVKMSVSQKKRSPEINHRHAESLRGYKHSDEAKLNMSIARKNPSLEIRKQMSENTKGANNPRALDWFVEDKFGNIEHIQALKPWCAERGIKYTSLLFTATKTVKNGFYDGFRVRRASHG